MKNISIIWGLLALIIANDAWSCAVCGVALEASRLAFIYSTAILSLIPLAMIGGLIYYLYYLDKLNQKKSEPSDL
ncbi:hypothetical protein TI05_06855 [Achromatium sp. WMS3]|nr:hypothetical protein TI05_06855 [Achromatium sp. WMS3]